jgi:hypothetical protein
MKDTQLYTHQLAQSKIILKLLREMKALNQDLHGSDSTGDYICDPNSCSGEIQIYFSFLQSVLRMMAG